MITRGLAGQWPPPSGSLPVPPRPPFTPPTRQTPSSAAQNPGPLAQGSLPTPGSLWGTSLPPATPLSAEPSCESAELPLLPKLAVHGAPAPPPGLVQPRSGHPLPPLSKSLRGWGAFPDLSPCSPECTACPQAACPQGRQAFTLSDPLASIRQRAQCPGTAPHRRAPASLAL